MPSRPVVPPDDWGSDPPLLVGPRVSSSTVELLTPQEMVPESPFQGGLPRFRRAVRGGGSESDEDPPVCPDEDPALSHRILAMRQVPPPNFSTSVESSASPQRARSRSSRSPTSVTATGGGTEVVAQEPGADDRDLGWCGHVAAERADGPRPPLTRPRAARAVMASQPVPEQPRAQPSVPAQPRASTPLSGAQLHLRTALQALAACDANLGGHLEGQRRGGVDPLAQKASALSVELEDARLEAYRLRREMQKLRGAPEEIATLPTNALYALQLELSAALQCVHNELECRTKCCVCRDAERQVMLRPCQHFVLCIACSKRVDRCPMCNRAIDKKEAVCVA